VTIIPIILRNLAPSSGFDPQEVWEKEQKLDALERDQEDEEENANSGKKGKKEKKKVVKKKDAIIANNKIAKVDKLFERDMEIITNKKRDGKSKSDLFLTLHYLLLTLSLLFAVLLWISEIKSKLLLPSSSSCLRSSPLPFPRKSAP
jgi:hypothetical protein